MSEIVCLYVGSISSRQQRREAEQDESSFIPQSPKHNLRTVWLSYTNCQAMLRNFHHASSGTKYDKK